VTGGLDAVAASWLMLQPAEEPRWVVEGLIAAGLHILAGAPKVGKSWLVLDLAVHVSLGKPMWEMTTSPCEVLYLCLEDTYARVQRRLWALADELGEEVWVVVSACSMAEGLVGQIGVSDLCRAIIGVLLVHTELVLKRLKLLAHIIFALILCYACTCLFLNLVFIAHKVAFVLDNVDKKICALKGIEFSEYRLLV
jgi:hypothetical protein